MDELLSLTENRESIYVNDPYSKYLWEGKQKLIINSKLYKNSIGKVVYLVDDNKCYGVIKINSASKIENADEFNKLYESHNISDDIRNKWWPNKSVLFAYDYEPVKLFDNPVDIKLNNPDKNMIIDNFEFENEELIKDPLTYDPEKQSKQALLDDFRIVTAWYSSKKDGKHVKFSYEDIINLAKIIHDRLLKLGVEFHPETMKPNARELYEKIKGNVTERESSYKEFEQLGTMTIIKDFICAVGSYVNGKKNYNDIDLLIKMANPTDYIKRAVEVRILKSVDWAENIHFVWGDPEGPHDSYVPMYDLVLVRQPLKKVEMSEMFKPMKPSIRFYDINDAVEYAFKNSDKFAVEKKYNGFRGVLVKKENSAELYSDQGKNISKHFNSILNQASSLTTKSFILDGELVYKDGGRSEIAKYITGNEPLDDSDITFWAFDLLSYDNKDLEAKEWGDRKSTLHSLSFSKNIKEVYSMIVNNKDQMKKAIELAKNMKGSEGAMIKSYSGKYTKNGESKAWIKFRNEDPLSVIITKVENDANGKSYTVGIKIDNAKKFNEKYVDNGILILGNTFVTKEDFSIGDHIIINVEEVWRHEYSDGTIRYSIHKPKVMGKSNISISTPEHLDNLAVSKGESVAENQETTTSTPGVSDTQGTEIGEKIEKPPKPKDEDLFELAGEGGDAESDINNFPERMISNFNKNIDKENDFVIQWHLRGNKSVHTDLRMDTGEILEGFTLFTPGNIDNENELTPDAKNIRGTIKSPQPKDWLTVDRGMPRGAPGTTANSNAYFAIVGKGKYKVIEADNHKIHIDFKSDSFVPKHLKPLSKDDTEIVDHFNSRLPGESIKLNGVYSYHIAHIGNRHIILFDKVKE